jgi:hypothetical protein
MAQRKKVTKLAVRSKMHEKLKTITEQLKAIKEESEAPYKTNGEFRKTFQDNRPPINIHKVMDIGALINILGFLIGKLHNYEDAARLLELKEYPAFHWQNFSFESWKYDINIRLKQLTHKQKIEKLYKAKQRLESFLSEEDKLELLIKEIEKMGL